jgi:hypothetical protein
MPHLVFAHLVFVEPTDLFGLLESFLDSPGTTVSGAASSRGPKTT